jgi:hypothetical protein
MGNPRERLVAGLAATLLGVTAAAPSGVAYAAPTTTATFSCPPQDLRGRPVMEHSASASELFCRYEKVPNDFFCKYFSDTGMLKQDHDNGECPPVARHG